MIIRGYSGFGLDVFKEAQYTATKEPVLAPSPGIAPIQATAFPQEESFVSQSAMPAALPSPTGVTSTSPYVAEAPQLVAAPKALPTITLPDGTVCVGTHCEQELKAYQAWAAQQGQQQDVQEALAKENAYLASLQAQAQAQVEYDEKVLQSDAGALEKAAAAEQAMLQKIAQEQQAQAQALAQEQARAKAQQQMPSETGPGYEPVVDPGFTPFEPTATQDLLTQAETKLPWMWIALGLGALYLLRR